MPNSALREDRETPDSSHSPARLLDFSPGSAWSCRGPGGGGGGTSSLCVPSSHTGEAGPGVQEQGGPRAQASTLTDCPHIPEAASHSGPPLTLAPSLVHSGPERLRADPRRALPGMLGQVSGERGGRLPRSRQGGPQRSEESTAAQTTPALPAAVTRPAASPGLTGLGPPTPRPSARLVEHSGTLSFLGWSTVLTYCRIHGPLQLGTSALPRLRAASSQPPPAACPPLHTHFKLGTGPAPAMWVRVPLPA